VQLIFLGGFTAAPQNTSLERLDGASRQLITSRCRYIQHSLVSRSFTSIDRAIAIRHWISAIASTYFGVRSTLMRRLRLRTFGLDSWPKSVPNSRTLSEPLFS
jgi:hypothetical protein